MKHILLFSLVVVASGCQGNSDHPEVVFERGRLLAERGNHVEAIPLFDKAESALGDRAELYYQRGVSYQALNLYEKALEDYNKCLSLDSDHTGALNNKGVVLASLDRFQEAADQFGELIRRRSDDVLALRNRGLCLHDLQRFDEAISDYNAALQHAPNDVECWFQRGNVYLEQGKLEQAEADFTHAISIDESYAKAWMNRGVARMKSGHRETGLADLQQASTLDKNIILPDLDWVVTAPAAETGTVSSTELVAAKPIIPELTIDWDQCLKAAQKKLADSGFEQLQVVVSFPDHQCARLTGAKQDSTSAILVAMTSTSDGLTALPALPPDVDGENLTLVLMERGTTVEEPFVVTSVTEQWQPPGENIRLLLFENVQSQP